MAKHPVTKPVFIPDIKGQLMMFASELEYAIEKLTDLHSALTATTQATDSPTDKPSTTVTQNAEPIDV